MTALLTTVIGLIGVYTAFALAASWVNEQIATFLKLRSKTLVAGIRKMVGDAATARFFDHPLIDSLGEAPAQNAWAKLGLIFGLKYAGQKIPGLPTDVQAAQPEATTQTGTPPKTETPVKNISYVNSSHFASVMVDVLLNKTNASVPSFGASASDVVAALNGISAPGNPYEPLYKILLPIWNGAKGDYDQFVAALSSWYDSHMERVSGWYKRNIQIMLVYIGLLIALAFNVDTIQIINTLQHNTALSNALAAVTQAYYQRYANAKPGSPPPNASDFATATEQCATTHPCTCRAGFIPDSQSNPQVCRIDQSLFAQLPLGWTDARWKTFSDAFLGDPKHAWYQRLSESSFWLKLFGLAITTLAILLGAPFWFDVLGTIVNVRSVGGKPPTSSAT